MRRIALLSLVALLTMTMVLASCTGTQPQPTPPESEQLPQIKSEVLIEFMGSVATESEPFTITEAPWAIAWAFQPAEPTTPEGTDYSNLFRITVKRPGDDAYTNAAVDIADRSGLSSDFLYLDDDGTFYLDIESAAGSWTIQVIIFTTE